LKNKNTRNNQANANHTSGSRGFVVVHDQQVGFPECVHCTEINDGNCSSELAICVCLQEIMLGRRVGRAELYCVTHTNKDGAPVDLFSAKNIVSICTVAYFVNSFNCNDYG
jgi:hypothetical protein